MKLSNAFTKIIFPVIELQLFHVYLVRASKNLALAISILHLWQTNLGAQKTLSRAMLQEEHLLYLASQIIYLFFKINSIFTIEILLFL